MFNVKKLNAAGRRLTQMVSADMTALNIIDCLAAPTSAAQIANLPEVAWALRTRFTRATAHLPRTRPLEALEKRLTRYLAGMTRPVPSADGELVLCPTFRVGDDLVRTIGMTMRFGASRDVTLEELSLDVLYPRDDASARYFQDAAKLTR